MLKEPTLEPYSGVTRDPRLEKNRLEKNRLEKNRLEKNRLEKNCSRTFTRKPRLRIFLAADTYKQGKFGTLLKRKKLFSNQLSDPRREYTAILLSKLTVQLSVHMNLTGSAND